MVNKLNIFIKRLNKIGINITLVSNFPWIYIATINNKVIIEKFNSKHCFTLGLISIKGGEFNFSDTKEIFELIRKYR